MTRLKFGQKMRATGIVQPAFRLILRLFGRWLLHPEARDSFQDLQIAVSAYSNVIQIKKRRLYFQMQNEEGKTVLVKRIQWTRDIIIVFSS